MTAQATPLHASLVDASVLAPIAEGAAAGPDLTYDASIEPLAAEVEKSTALAGEQPDWSLVARESGRLLRESTKDLRIASWWVVAVARVDSWTEIAGALATYCALVDRFWSELHPSLKRLRARGALIGWLAENLAKALATRPVTSADGDAVLAVATAAAALEETATQRFGDASPSLGPVRSALREKQREIASQATAPPAVAPAPAGTSSTGSPEAASRSVAPAPPAEAPRPAPIVESATPSTLEEAVTATGRARDTLFSYARAGRLAAPASPWPYRVARAIAWLNLDTPPQIEGGKTFVRSPRAPDRSALVRLYEAASWDALRDAAEDALSEHIFWLDLHRYTAVALDRLGPAYAGARVALVRETMAFVERMPSLPTLVFANGTPFAAPETLEWLAQQRPAASAPSRSEAADEPLGALEACANRIRGGQVDEALADALGIAKEARGAPARFRARLAVARLALGASREAVSSALVESLLEEIDATLEAWQPGLCAEVITMALRPLQGKGKSGGDDSRQTLLFQRLLALDPSAALRLGR